MAALCIAASTLPPPSSTSTFLAGLLAEAAKAVDVRDGIAPDELARFCLHALTAGSTVPSADAVSRLVTLIMAALRPPG